MEKIRTNSIISLILLNAVRFISIISILIVITPRVYSQNIEKIGIKFYQDTSYKKIDGNYESFLVIYDLKYESIDTLIKCETVKDTVILPNVLCNKYKNRTIGFLFKYKDYIEILNFISPLCDVPNTTYNTMDLTFGHITRQDSKCSKKMINTNDLYIDYTEYEPPVSFIIQSRFVSVRPYEPEFVLEAIKTYESTKK